jgi:hypothetical protein
VLDRPCRPSTSLAGGHRSVAPRSPGRVSVPRLGSSGRASTNPSFVGSACSSYDDVRFRAPSCRRSPSCFRAKASLSWGFCPRPPLLRASARACLSRGLVPPRSGTCSSQAPASLPLARPRSPTFAGCHGTPPRLRGLLPRGDRLPSSGVTRPGACFPSSGFPPLGSSPARCPARLAARRVHPWRCRYGLRRTMAVRGRLRRFAPLLAWLAVSGLPTHSRFEAFRRLALAMRLLRVSTGGAETALVSVQRSREWAGTKSGKS